MDEQTIGDAYEQLKQARSALWEATERAIRARLMLEKERAARLMTGEITGKNESEREARARELLHSLYESVEAAEAEERRARLEYDLTKLEVERVEALLRWLKG
ncbi:MAG: hypothetical protein KatS3mg053_3223 [Candidatus Roseilinea sp.]|nr:MAG: hypothetical protein KatS3mg053_3223 [Candidatus Roseilinea sp.]